MVFPRVVSHLLLRPKLLMVGALVTPSLFASDGQVNSNRSFGLEPNGGYVSAIAKAPDGKLVAVGPFASLNGHASPKIVRLHQNGAVDRTFVSPATTASGDDVRAVAVQFDGRMVVGGLFTEFGGFSAPLLTRLTTEGLVDPTFHFNPPAGAQVVSSIATLPDGGMIVAGLAYPSGFAQGFLQRLKADGSFDPSLQVGVAGFATSVLPQTDGKILVGGANFRVNATTDRYRVVRLNVDGSWDSTWNYGLVGSSGGVGVTALAFQADGKLLVGLPGFSVGPVLIERVLSDGNVDPDFHPGAVGNNWSLVDFDLQPDGKILVALNSSTSFTGMVVRLLADGSLDGTFAAGAGGNSTLRRIGMLPDGTAIVFGGFNSWSGINATGIVRIASLPTPAKIFSMSRTAGADELWEGARQDFSVVAGGTPDATIQWAVDGAPLNNATGETFTLNAVTPGQAGIYNVSASNAGGSDIGSGFRLKVKSGPPEFLADFFEDQSARTGGVAVIQGLAVGGPLPTLQWLKDGIPIQGQTGPTLTLSNLQSGFENSVFTLLAQNSHGSFTSAPVHLLSVDYGSIRSSFALQKRITSNFNSPSSGCDLSLPLPWPNVRNSSAIAVYSDGRILVGGGFSSNSWVSSHVQRLMPDGSQDTTFHLKDGADASGPDADVNALLIGADERIWLGGQFTKISGAPRNALARLNTDGSLDHTFSPAFTVNGQPGGNVNALIRQEDGKIIAGGNFERVNGTLHPFVVRLNTDGSVDETFLGALQFYSYAYAASLAVQRDGKILVGGRGPMISSATGNLIRLNKNGPVDPTFSPTPAVKDYTWAASLAVDPYDRILVGGANANYGDPSRTPILRLLDDGSRDPTFHAPANQGSVTTIAVQPNGRILVGGLFNPLGDNPTQSLARLRPDGSVDLSFVQNSFVGGVNAIALVNDGLLVAGGFSTQERFAEKIGNCVASTIDNGLVKLSVGNVTESFDPPQIVEQPVGGIVFGGDFTFQVTATGATPLSYSWYRDARFIKETAEPSFTLFNVKPENTAIYTVRVKNKFGSVLSNPAGLEVVGSVSSTSQATVGTNGFKFNFALANNGHFEDADLQQVHLQVSEDLEFWETIDAAIRLVNGEVELVDPGAVLKPQRFYRFIWGTIPPPDPTATADDSSLVAISALPAVVRHAAELHLQEFIKPSARGHNPTVGGQEWIGVTFAPQARYLYDPAYHDGNDPAYVEFKMIHTRSRTARGYMLVSMNEEDFPILEFSTMGNTKTERVLAQARTGVVHKFFRLTPAFFTAEDTNGNLVTQWGTSPAKADLTALEGVGRLQLTYDSESDTALLPRFPRPTLTPYATYAELKNDLKTNPLRLHLRSLRVAQAATHWVPVRGERYPTLQIPLGETNVFFPTQVYTSARVDAADDVPNVSAVALREGGVRVVGLHVGSDIVRFRTASGALLAYSIIVLSPTAGFTIQSECEDSENQDWWAGDGWDGDQRQYWQMFDDNWCPAVGCGPTALAMLLGWWDYHGVPSAFYRLKSRTEGLAAISFRFDYSSLRSSDAPKTFRDNAYTEEHELLHDVYDDLHDLCNTICFSFTDAGATYPDQMVSAFLEYTRRASKPLLPPMNEFGDRFIGCKFEASYVPPGSGQTDWEGGGTFVANGIKDGHPGVIGIGGPIWDCHYPLAYVYRRHSHYVGCGSDRHRDSLTRAFKCNMGWGPNNPPEWHNAESVWFGLTTTLWQKKLPVWTIKTPVPVPGVFFQ